MFLSVYSHVLPTEIRGQTHFAILPRGRLARGPYLMPACNRAAPVQTHRAFHRLDRVHGTAWVWVDGVGDLLHLRPRGNCRWQQGESTAVTLFPQRATHSPMLFAILSPDKNDRPDPPGVHLVRQK